MNRFSRFIQILLSAWQSGSSRSRVYVMPNRTPETDETCDSEIPSGRGQRERHNYAFRPIRAGDTITSTCETWTREGDLLDGNTTELRVITASGKVVDSAEEIVSICSNCGLGEDVEIRSAISQLSLCRTCVRQFQQPNGEIILVSPNEQNALLENQDTWALHDFRNFKQ